LSVDGAVEAVLDRLTAAGYLAGEDVA
jgi:hypothetical protein